MWHAPNAVLKYCFSLPPFILLAAISLYLLVGLAQERKDSTFSLASFLFLQLMTIVDKKPKGDKSSGATSWPSKQEGACFSKALSLCSLSPKSYFTDKAESRVCLSLQLWFQPSLVPAGLGKKGGKQGEQETETAPTHRAWVPSGLNSSRFSNIHFGWLCASSSPAQRLEETCYTPPFS